MATSFAFISTDESAFRWDACLRHDGVYILMEANAPNISLLSSLLIHHSTEGFCITVS